MGLRALVANAAALAVAAVGDIAVSTNYESFVSTGTYTASTGALGTSYSTTAGVGVIFTNFRVVEVDGTNIRPEDKRALIPSNSLASAPSVSDRIIADASIVWVVQGIMSDPADALYKLHVRRP